MKRLAAVAGVLVGLAALAGWWVLRDGGGDTSAPADAPAVAVAPVAPLPEGAGDGSGSATLRSVTGRVEARRDGAWQVAVPGMRVDENDALRTGPGGAAVLGIGHDGSEVLLKEQSEVSIRQLSEEVARVRLERGRVGADLAGGVLLRVEAAGSAAVAETKRGKFSVFTNGTGLVAIASETAAVKLATPQGESRVGAGQQVAVEANHVAAPTAIPEEVFLNVRWPEKDATRDAALLVTGTASTASEVRVNGHPAPVAADGTFSISVPLRQGDNAIAVEAQDALGRRKASRKKVRAYHSTPKVGADAEAMWR